MLCPWLQVAGRVLKHQPPPDAAQPDKKWRLYMFKGDNLAEDEPIYLHRLVLRMCCLSLLTVSISVSYGSSLWLWFQHRSLPPEDAEEGSSQCDDLLGDLRLSFQLTFMKLGACSSGGSPRAIVEPP